MLEDDCSCNDTSSCDEKRNGRNVVSNLARVEERIASTQRRQRFVSNRTTFEDGSVRVWDARAHEFLSMFKEHTEYITNIRFASDGRLCLSSWDGTASIVALDTMLKLSSAIKLIGHSAWVNSILPLPSLKHVVTCSDDKTIKVLDWQTGSCVRTLAEHTQIVTFLDLAPK